MKRLLASLVCATILATGFFSAASAQEASTLDAAIEKFIMEHPEVILKSLKKYQGRDKITEEQRKKLEKSDVSPIIGNKNGNVTMIEFFDYHCGYCKRFYSVVSSLVESDKNLKIVFKELPIISEDSEIAARAALAVHFIDSEKYFAFHSALMKVTGKFDMDKISSLAKTAGIDEKLLKDMMQSQKVNDELANNKQLAEELDVSGTPVIIIGKNFMPGAVPLETIRAKIEETRRAK
jgi:protein-disulfide isomerase